MSGAKRKNYSDPLKIAAMYAFTEHTEVACIIQDLVELVKAQEILLACHRIKRTPPDELFNAIKRLRARTIDLIAKEES